MAKKNKYNSTGKTSYAGLQTNINSWKESNALSKALNVVLKRTETIEPRNGFEYYVKTTHQPLSFMTYQKNILWHDADNNLNYSSTKGEYSTYTNTYYNVTNASMRGDELRGNFYFTTQDGIKVISNITTEPYDAGVPEALDITLTANSSGGWAKGSTQISYKITFVKTDNNNYVKRSAPSYGYVFAQNNKVDVTGISRSGSTATATVGSHTFANGDLIEITGAIQTEYNGTYSISNVTPTSFDYTVSGTPLTPATTSTKFSASKNTNVDLEFTVPDGILEGDEYEIWRSKQSSDVNIKPLDTMFLVFRGEYTSGKTISYTDITDDDYLSSTPLYTSNANETITQANYKPPLSSCISQFHDHVFYANTQRHHSMQLKLISTTGDLVDDTSYIRISNGIITETYTFSGSENINAKKFKRYTTGTVSENIVNTIYSLIRVINRSSTYYYAKYVSGELDPPGIFQIWVRKYDFGEFYVKSDNITTGDNFIPTIPTDNSNKSGNDAKPNRIYFSKYLEPEAVPLENYKDVGSQTSNILQIVPLTNALLIFKEDGVFYLNGSSTQDFSVKDLDKSTYCVNPDTIALLSNKVFMLSNQGIVSVNESGVKVISLPINDRIDQILKLSNISYVGCGIGFEMDRQYILYVPQNENDTYGTYAYVYDLASQEYTEWDKPCYSGIVGYDNTLYLSSGNDVGIISMRKSGTLSDASDEEIDIEITSVNDKTLIITYDYVIPLDEGFSIHQVASQEDQNDSFAKIKSVEKTGTNTYQIIIDRKSFFTTGDASVRIPIYTEVIEHPNTCGNGSVTKTFLDLHFLFSKHNITNADIIISSNENGGIYSLSHITIDLSGWGYQLWGSTWGTVNNRSIPIRENIPRNHQSAESIIIGFKHSVSHEKYTLVGSNISYSAPTNITESPTRNISE